MSPHRKKWEKQCFEVFSQGLEDMHQELSKDGEDHKLVQYSHGDESAQRITGGKHVKAQSLANLYQMT